MQTCLNAVASTAAASRQPVPVIDRELLWEGGVVEIEVPLEARRGQVDDNGNLIHFLQWRVLVVNGMLNLFLHVPEEQINLYRGDKFNAEVKVWKKVHKDNRTFIHIDVVPASGGPTHALYVLNNMGPKWTATVPYARADWTVIETPMPLQGAVVLVPLTAMRLDMPMPGKVSATTSLSVPVSTTGDSGLDRQLAQGWSILAGSETDKTITLYKGEGEHRKTITHHKPQPKTKKKKR